MYTFLVQQAAHNNAAWCDAVFRAHGLEGRFEPGLWSSEHPAPPFYPNLVTLSPSGISRQLDRVREMTATRPDGPWAVKDSFCRLELAPSGFKLLFNAQWMVRPARGRSGPAAATGAHWRRVSDAAGLRAWEAAWRLSPANRIPESLPAMFPPSLLEDSDIAFLAAYSGGGMIAGAVANRAHGIAGLTNVFTPDGGARHIAGCLEAVNESFPGTPVAGYESDEAVLEVFAVLGFERAGPLRVWVTES
jgi:hypothetical protein